MMASIWTLQFHPATIPHRVSSDVVEIRAEWESKFSYRILNRKERCRRFSLRASFESITSDGDNRGRNEAFSVKSEGSEVAATSRNPFVRLQEAMGSLPSIAFWAKRYSAFSFATGICVTATLLIVAIRVYVARKSRYKRPGTVADLVRRGQLKFDRRGISKSLMFDDPFDNPLVKVSKSNSTVEMCGKVYRLAPVTLTREQQTSHQKRRSRAYQWKRPTIFLREGDSMPPDVDPETVRWIPANHPFATTASDIDEDLAQNNVYQKHGVPFRIQAEHEALQKKLEALQNEQKFNNLVIDPGTARNFERPFKPQLRPDEQEVEHNSPNGQASSKPPFSDREHDSFENNSNSEP